MQSSRLKGVAHTARRHAPVRPSSAARQETTRPGISPRLHGAPEALFADAPEAATWSAERARAAYVRMRFARAIDQKLTNLAKQGRSGVYTPMRGQEAAQVAAGLALSPRDWLVPTFRDTAAILQRDVPLERVLLYWLGFEEANLHTSRTLPIAAPVGSQVPHAVGLGWASALRRQDGAALALFGDGATSTGDVHEALNLAGAVSAPVVFFCQNNGWALSTPTRDQTRGSIVARADGYGMPGVAVDGADAEVVFEAVREAVQRARAGEGPTLIEARVHRAGPHSTTDDPRLYGGNVTEREQPLRDPVRRLRHRLLQDGQWSDDLDAQLGDAIAETIRRGVEGAERLAAGLRDDADALFDHVHEILTPELSAQRRERRGGRVRLPNRREAPRAPRLTGQAPAAPDRDGQPQQENLASAVRRALDDALTEQSDVVMLGEDIGQLGGVFRVTEGLLERHGAERVIDTPICESGFTGAAIGLAVAGLRPVVEIQFGGFLYPAHDQLRSHAARMRTRTRGQLTAPMVVRAPYGSGVGAPESHCDTVEMLAARTPGLSVVVPSTPARAYGLLRSAIDASDPVVFLEPMARYRSAVGVAAETGWRAPLGRTFVDRVGDDLTIVTYGVLHHRVMAGAEVLSKEHGVEATVLDLATLSPLDIGPIIASVARTGRLLVVHEAHRFADIGAEIVARLHERGLHDFCARRLTGWDVPHPFPGRERHFLDGCQQLVAVGAALAAQTPA